MLISMRRIKTLLARLLLGAFAWAEPTIRKSLFLRKMITVSLRLVPGLRSLMGTAQEDAYIRLESRRDRRLLLIDTTHMVKNELHTGIQRVVRAILNELEKTCPPDAQVEAVVLTSRGGYWHFEYNSSLGSPTTEIVVPSSGDVFLGLDLNTNVIEASNAGLFADWRKRGCRIVFTIHDILPIQNPSWWPDGIGSAHEQWLRTILAESDQTISVSKTTAEAAHAWANKQGIDTSQLQFDWFHLGADISNSRPTLGMPDSSVQVLEQLTARPTFLVVGTLEPRKGHQQCLAAFELLWAKEKQLNLVFVGKEGWMVDELIDHISHHPELGKRFFWLHGVSDEYLEKIYQASTCLIACSLGEGFGLPVIEAAQHGLPVIARDIPIFREVAGEYAEFYSGSSTHSLATKVEQWLAGFVSGNQQPAGKMTWLTWAQSAAQLAQALQWPTRQPSAQSDTSSRIEPTQKS